MLFIIGWAVVGLSAIWVYWDASSKRVGEVEGLKSFTNMSAGAWGAATLLLWIVGFPLYLVNRAKLIERAEVSPRESSLRPLKAILLALPPAALVAFQFMSSGISACDSPPIQALARQVATQNIPSAVLSSFGAVEAESTSDRRVCRVQVQIEALPASWAVFTVEPHGEGQVFLQFRPQ
ncbi:MAG: hypothetical protein ACI9KE_002045 [Polyangiales bacterium]